MRKLIIILILLLAVSAGAYFYFTRPLQSQTAMEEVLPGDTLAMVRICDLKKQIETFKAGKMGQSLGNINLPQLMTAMNVQPSRQSEITRGIEEFQTGINSVWFKSIFGRDACLSFLDLDKSKTQPESFDPRVLLDGLVFISRPEKSVQVLDCLKSMFDSELSVQTEDYGQWQINRFVLETGQPVYYALHDGLLISGFSMAPVQQCLDQSLNPATSLARTEAYQRHCAGFYKQDQTDLLGYINSGLFLSRFYEIMQQIPDKDPDLKYLLKRFDKMKGIETVNFVQYDDGGPMIRTRMIMAIDRTKMGDYLARATAVRPAENPTLAHAPEDTLVYSWMNNFDLNLYWQDIVEQLSVSSPEVVEQVNQGCKAHTGMDMDTLLEAFGTQAGLLIRDVNMDGMFPFPEIALLMETKQPDVVDQLIRQQFTRYNIPLQQETYQEKEVRYLMLPLGENLSPAYTFSDGFCTIAINRPLLEEMLDTPEQTHLGVNPYFKAFGREITGKNNQVFFMDVQGLLEKAHKLVAWGMTSLAMLGGQKTDMEKAKLVVELGINPVLDGFSMIKAVGGRVYSDEDKIVSDGQVLMDRF